MEGDAITTIAANRWEMAADSLVSNDQDLCSGMNKLAVNHLCVFGVAGPVSEALLFRDWIAAWRPVDAKPGLGDEFEALVLERGGRYLPGPGEAPKTHPGKLLRYYQRLVPEEIDADFWAIGSGAAVAIGAMAAGASPKEAVEIACRYDLQTGPPVVIQGFD